MSNVIRPNFSSKRQDEPSRDGEKVMEALCLYGEEEQGSLCPSLDQALARVSRIPGGHVLDASSAAMAAAMVLRALP